MNPQDVELNGGLEDADRGEDEAGGAGDGQVDRVSLPVREAELGHLAPVDLDHAVEDHPELEHELDRGLDPAHEGVGEHGEELRLSAQAGIIGRDRSRKTGIKRNIGGQWLDIL